MIKSSIIIPTSGRPVAIRAAIKSLLAISPDDHCAEIIIVDNNTSEELSASLTAYCETLAKKVRYVRESSPGLSAARHRGAMEARSDQLTFIDDDVEVSEKWLPAIQRAFSNNEVAMVGGPSIPKFTCSIPAWFWSYLGPTSYGGWMCSWLSLLDIGKDIPNINPNFIWGLNFSIRRSVLEACGGFHPDLVPVQFQRWQGDGENGLTFKVQKAGYRADYIQDALLFHLCGPERLNIEYFKKRAYYQGVCDSFTAIRQGQVPSTSMPFQEATISLYHRVRHFMGRTLRGLSAQCGPVSFAVAESAGVKKLTDQAHRDGWLFHQREAASDSALLGWIRRENYFATDIQVESDRDE